MTELLAQGRYWGRAVGAGLYVLVLEMIALGHMPTPEEAFIPLMKGAGAVLVAFGLNATTRAK